jgi:hypothetical protein
MTLNHQLGLCKKCKDIIFSETQKTARMYNELHALYDWVTIGGIWICNCIYWTLTNPRLQVIITVFLIHTLYTTIHYSTHFSLLSLLCLHRSSRNAFQRRTFLFLWLPELPPASGTSFTQQHLTRTELQQSSHWLTDWFTSQLTPLH